MAVTRVRVTFVDFLMAPADSVNESNHLKGTTGLTQPRDQPGLALSAILIAEYARLAQAVAAQPVWTKQTVALLVNGADRLLVGDRRPDQSVHVFHRLDFRFDDAHLTFTIPLVRLIPCPLSTL